MAAPRRRPLSGRFASRLFAAYERRLLALRKEERLAALLADSREQTLGDTLLQVQVRTSFQVQARASRRRPVRRFRVEAQQALDLDCRQGANDRGPPPVQAARVEAALPPAVSAAAVLRYDPMPMVPLHEQAPSWPGLSSAPGACLREGGQRPGGRPRLAEPRLSNPRRPVWRPVARIRVAPRAVRRPFCKARPGSMSGRMFARGTTRPSGNDAGPDAWTSRRSTTFAAGCCLPKAPCLPETPCLPKARCRVLSA